MRSSFLMLLSPRARQQQRSGNSDCAYDTVRLSRSSVKGNPNSLPKPSRKPSKCVLRLIEHDEPNTPLWCLTVRPKPDGRVGRASNKNATQRRAARSLVIAAQDVFQFIFYNRSITYSVSEIMWLATKSWVEEMAILGTSESLSKSRKPSMTQWI